MNTEDLIEMISVRIGKIKQRADEANNRKTDILIGKHESGVFDAIMGTNGEVEFLEKVLGELKK